jgi:NAD-dependent SIR2 family protein deacetylase
MIFMGKQVLKVHEDFYQQDFTEGDIVPFFEGKYRILETHFQNEYGVFILCEYLEEFERDTNSIVEEAIPAHKNNPYEVVGSIHMKGYRNLMAGPGFFIKDNRTGQTKGYSFRETMQLLMREGATNAVATRSVSGVFHSSVIDSIEGLPSFDSHFWKKYVYDQNGEPFAELTDAAHREVKKALEYAIKNLISKYRNQHRFEKVPNESVVALREIVSSAKNIVLLTGAGVSTISGIPDYRSSVESLYVKNPAILSKLNEQTFQKNPEDFWRTFYQFLQDSVATILPFPTHDAFLAARKVLKPNNVHRFFASLQEEKNVIIITQNVDGFHEQAGSENVIEFHGNVNECVCPNCYKIKQLGNFIEKLETPTCECGTILRPNVVFFGDAVRGYEQARKAVKEADLIIVAGTSLNVSPFNTLPQYKRNDAKLVLLNSGVGSLDYPFDLAINGDISEVVYQLTNNKK